MLFIKLLFESFRFAVHALKENILRTVLSLLGVTVGIFAIIAIFTLVDALNNGIQNSLSSFGNNIIYIGKWPFAFGDGDYPWWKYYRRPNPDRSELKFIQENAKWVKSIAIYESKGGNTINFGSNTFEDGKIIGGSYEYNKVNSMPIGEGRYFTQGEMNAGAQKVLIGAEVAKQLFPRGDGLGKIVKAKGAKFQVIGIFEKQGESFIPTPSVDDVIFIPYNSFTKIYASKGRWISTNLIAKGFDKDEDLGEMLAEVRGLLRIKRGLKPKEEDNFALNRTDAIVEFVEGITFTMKIAGGIIGLFSILVGGFSIANIMFVSVKERTSQIGIQKALGAKNYFILLQFLCESMFLSFFGGIGGLFLVSLLSLLSTETFVIALNFANLLIGLGISAVIGIISGIAPAVSASKMDPVEAMRAA